MDSNLEEIQNDLKDKRISYQLHHQQVFSNNEEHEDHICVTSSKVGHVSLRMPSKEEIDRITTEMISQVHSDYNLRNWTIRNDIGKPSGIFIKDITHKMKDEDKKAKVEIVKGKEENKKKWEPKRKVKFQKNEVAK